MIRHISRRDFLAYGGATGAALATGSLSSGARADDVVWDPFVGSGTELVERALAGPYARLLGSDTDPRSS